MYLFWRNCSLNWQVSNIQLLLVAEFLQERNNFKATIFIFWWTALSHYQLCVFLSQHFTQIHEDVFQLIGHHGAIFFLVIELENLHEVVIGTTVFVLFYALEHWEELIQLDGSLTLGSWHSKGLKLLVGWVEVQGSEEVLDVVGINHALAFKIIYVEGEFGPFMVLGAEFCFTHFGWCV